MLSTGDHYGSYVAGLRVDLVQTPVTIVFFTADEERAPVGRPTEAGVLQERKLRC